jgi:hypothetical protein
MAELLEHPPIDARGGITATCALGGELDMKFKIVIRWNR